MSVRTSFCIPLVAAGAWLTLVPGWRASGLCAWGGGARGSTRSLSAFVSLGAVCPIGGPFLATAGADVFTGTAAVNTLCGKAGNDQLAGAGGNDCVDGGSGKDRIAGNGVNDTLMARGGGSGDTDTVLGGAGNDTAFVNLAGDTVTGVEWIRTP